MTKTTKATKIKKTEVKILCQDYVPKNKKSLSFLVSYFLRKLVSQQRARFEGNTAFTIV